MEHAPQPSLELPTPTQGDLRYDEWFTLIRQPGVTAKLNAGDLQNILTVGYAAGHAAMAMSIADFARPSDPRNALAH